MLSFHQTGGEAATALSAFQTSLQIKGRWKFSWKQDGNDWPSHPCASFKTNSAKNRPAALIHQGRSLRNIRQRDRDMLVNSLPNENGVLVALPVHSKKSILRMKTAFIDCAEANFLFVVAICIVLS